MSTADQFTFLHLKKKLCMHTFFSFCFSFGAYFVRGIFWFGFTTEEKTTHTKIVSPREQYAEKCASLPILRLITHILYVIAKYWALAFFLALRLFSGPTCTRQAGKLPRRMYCFWLSIQFNIHISHSIGAKLKYQ